MELSGKVIFTSCQIAPSSPYVKQTVHEVVNTKATGFAFASTIFTAKRSKSQYLSLASTPSKYLKCLPLVRQSNAYDELSSAHALKLKALKDMLLAKEGEDQFGALEMVDAIQRLGIDYHFREEIRAILKRLYMTFASSINDLKLSETATLFRLLRQEGYYVPAGVFNKFKDGSIKCNSSGDIEGLMALYEASQLSIKEEDELEEARDYSYQLLNSSMTQLDNGQAKLIQDTLEHPHHKSLAKFMARNFLKKLRGENGWESDLIGLAKLEFKMVQSQHQQEIVEITKWWKDLGLYKELKFARDQPLKWYVWTMACLTDPMLSEERIELTKPVSFIYIIDDIFDVYGKLDDLILFTQVVNRWDMAAAEHLPDCMKICFKALDNVTNEISYKIFKKHRGNPLEYLRKSWASLCNAFLVEAKWFASGKLPKAEAYLKNGIISTGVHVLLVHLFFLSGEGMTKETVELLDNNLGMISSPATILRLWDDLGNAEDENQQGQDGSYLKCYMSQHQECSSEAARQHVTDLISEAWKQLNQECLSPNPFSSTFTGVALNVARIVPLMYNYDRGHRLPSLEEHVNYLLSETVSL